MKIVTLLMFLGPLTVRSIGQTDRRPTSNHRTLKNIANSVPINIKWIASIKGNFSFRYKWSYPEGVFKNDYGQVACDGSCPHEIENMLDSTGKIMKDSIKAFYRIVDTSHIGLSISSTAWCYEWAGTDFIEVIRKTSDTVFLSTDLNAGTHCSLELSIIGDSCYALIDLNSVIKGQDAIFYCTDGFITFDKTLWQKGIVKALFSFNFRHLENTKRPMFWRGKIYSLIR